MKYGCVIVIEMKMPTCLVDAASQFLSKNATLDVRAIKLIIEFRC